MRTKRAQKRRAKRPSPLPRGLPDPFSRNNPGLVDYEDRVANDCPCCAERHEGWRLAEYARWYNLKPNAGQNTRVSRPSDLP